jgi:hypothetical protein
MYVKLHGYLKAIICLATSHSYTKTESKKQYLHVFLHLMTPSLQLDVMQSVICYLLTFIRERCVLWLIFYFQYLEAHKM